MIPVSFGIIHAAITAVEADLTDEYLDNLDPEQLAAAWKAISDICRVGDNLHDRLRSALTHRLISASRGTT